MGERACESKLTESEEVRVGRVVNGWLFVIWSSSVYRIQLPYSLKKRGLRKDTHTHTHTERGRDRGRERGRTRESHEDKEREKATKTNRSTAR